LSAGLAPKGSFKFSDLGLSKGKKPQRGRCHELTYFGE
jgi:hypothetical protein